MTLSRQVDTSIALVSWSKGPGEVIAPGELLGRASSKG